MRYKKYLMVALAVLILSFSSSQYKNNQEAFPFYGGKVTSELFKALPDHNDIYLVKDSVRTPIFYYSDIFTPVCTDNVCKPAELRLFWDVCCNFLGFKIPPDKPLTKKNHTNFSGFDYYTLFVILNNPNAEIGKTSKTALTSYTADDVDAVSGATSSGAEQWVVAGAAYSTYTLWHWVYDVKDSILPKTTPSKHPNDYWMPTCEALQAMTVPELTRFLLEAEQARITKKYKFQKALVAHIDSLPAIKAILINNYLHRIPVLPNDIEKALLKCKPVQNALNKMLP